MPTDKLDTASPVTRAAVMAVAVSVVTNIHDTRAGTWASAAEAVDAHQDIAEMLWRELDERPRGAVRWDLIRMAAVGMVRA